MNTPAVPARILSVAGLVVALMLFMSLVLAETPEEKEERLTVVNPLMTQELSDLPNKEVMMMTVEYLPGGASLPHRHDAHVFVYVLEGELVTQVAGQKAVTLKAGQVFYENPQDIHQTSANASKTAPMKFLVVALKDKDRELTRSASAND